MATFQPCLDAAAGARTAPIDCGPAPSERELPSITDDTDEANSLRDDAGELCARLGQTDRAASLLNGSGIDSISTLLAVAGKYPVAAGLREQALREAEHVSEPYAWQLPVEDAIKRGDQAEAFARGSVLAARWMARSNLTAWIRRSRSRAFC